MPIRFEPTCVDFEGHCAVDEALPLLEFLNAAPNPEARLDGCVSMHTALFQVLVALRPKILSLPPDPQLAGLLGRLAAEASA